MWLLVLELIGLATFALLFRLLPWLPDRGLSLARTIGLLLVAYLAWLLGSLKLAPFTPLTVWLCALPLLVAGAVAAWQGRVALRLFWEERQRAILSMQALYIVAFVFMLVLRWYNPDLWHPSRGGEKPMDFAYLNAVLRSPAFPPPDPWFAGGYINYYYFGFVLVGTLIHLTTIIPDVAYNLAIPTLFALTALGAWGIIYNLLAPRSYVQRPAREEELYQATLADVAEIVDVPPREPPVVYNTQGTAYNMQGAYSPQIVEQTVAQAVAHYEPPVMVAIGYNTQGTAYNMQQVRTEEPDQATAAAAVVTASTAPQMPPAYVLPDLAAAARREVPGWWRRIDERAMVAAWLAPLFMLILGNLVQAIWLFNGYAADNAHRPEWAFWDATRIVQGTINEFPFFTFLFADLHAHMIVMPFSLAVVGLLVALSKQTMGKWYMLYGSTTATPRLPLAYRRLPDVLVLVLLGLLAGTLRATNTWDYPTFVGLTLAVLAVLGWWQFRRDVRYEAWAVGPQSTAWLALRRALIVAGQVVLVVGAGNLLFAPFISNFATESSGIELLTEGMREGLVQQVLFAQRTTLGESLRLFGLWYFVLLSGGAVLLWRTLRLQADSSTMLSRDTSIVRFLLGALVGALAWQLFTSLTNSNPNAAPQAASAGPSSLVLLLPLLLVGTWLLWQVRTWSPRRLLPLLWGMLALAIVAGVEIVRVQGDVGSMNTVFKFGLHAWMLFALVAAVAVPWLWRMPRRLHPPPAMAWRCLPWRGCGAVLLWP
ncbi:MAG: hypothetical protein HC876_03360 [Chloroflexaceae bacterium]|nr:hypothetical protein [Chloroflexaceae bacterium]